jgi:uncharacterized protein (UPF0332 family)
MSNSGHHDYIQYRIKRADETIHEVSILIDNQLWNTAINRMYYVCFYAVTALLASRRIDTSTHAGVRLLFGKEFITTGLIARELGKHFTELFEKRQKGDYNDFFDFDQETVRTLYEPSIKFVKTIAEFLSDQNKTPMPV